MGVILGPEIDLDVVEKEIPELNLGHIISYELL
jgi:hypothetical protein